MLYQFLLLAQLIIFIGFLKTMNQQTYNQHIAQGYLTASKAPSQFTFPSGFDPFNFEPEIDFVNGLGVKINGSGGARSFNGKAEVDFAIALKEKFKMIEKVKILKTGTEACMGAVRIARAWQQKGGHPNWWNVWGSGYHGWSDLFNEQMPNNAGAFPSGYKKFNTFHDIITLIEKSGNNQRPAVVIVEPIQLDLADGGALPELKATCVKYGIILIFDEIITGMRFPGFSASEYF